MIGPMMNRVEGQKTITKKKKKIAPYLSRVLLQLVSYANEGSH